MLIGLVSGVIMAMQMARALRQYGAQGEVGQIVSIALMRELGPRAHRAAGGRPQLPAASPAKSAP